MAADRRVRRALILVTLPRTAAELARYIDHTLLAPEATQDEVFTLCRDAMAWNVAAVCISPSWLPLPSGTLAQVAGRDTTVKLCTVVGFPSGAHTTVTKAREAVLAVECGADEVDMVVNLGLVRDVRWSDIEAEVRGVRSAVDAARRGVVVKVICESAALSDDELRATCKAAVVGGADFLKTSTGFHKAGGATERAVSIMRETVGADIGVKASGGIRTTDAALAMIAAGATRIGASATREILAGMPS
ncbi:MAG: deoxyribose-phosphate aldolase [Actinobacteria bacterium]|nr:deoxyribose-phosphate aldolase [Actinomycetota bacterium]